MGDFLKHGGKKAEGMAVLMRNSPQEFTRL